MQLEIKTMFYEEKGHPQMDVLYETSSFSVTLAIFGNELLKFPICLK